MTLDAYAAPGSFANMDLGRGVLHATDEHREKMRALKVRVESVRAEHEIFKQWCDRADELYYASTLGKGGADLWPEHESAKINGRQHVSVNLPAPYVDIPSALQAVEPIENMLATDTTKEARDAASQLERAYTAWKREEDFDLKWHKAITTKSLYGRTAGRVYWDKDKDRPCLEVIHQPRHLYLGWKTDNYEELEWAAYRMYFEPNALVEAYGVEVTPMKTDGDVTVPFVIQRSWEEQPARPDYNFGDAVVEVWDYWYRKPVWRGQKFVRMETWNLVVAGNCVIRDLKYPEYKGRLPYVPLFNTFVPGMPSGRADLYDVEQLIREKMERITSGSQMIANVTRGDAFQLVGPEAPLRVPQGLKPIIGGIVAPGPGNRIEVITPFIAQFQLEQFLGRIDRELATISGLNDLLLGLAPAQVLSSSKAINALIANYEARLSLRRKMLYKWRRDVWELARDVFAQKSKIVGDLMKRGGGFLEIEDPSLSPRDDMETATRAINLVNAKLWSQRRAMDVVGVDDPETEQDLIREERTDATMFPADVQVMAQLLGALQALGLQSKPAEGMAQQQMASGQNDLAQAVGAAVPDNSAGSVLPGDQGVVPPEAGGSLVTPPEPALMQGMIQNGQAKGRIMTQQKLGRR